MKIVEKAPAKINLGLKILGKRSDGYHNILSVFQTVSIFDTIEISVSSSDKLECDDPSVPVDKRNLVMKAAEAFRRETGIYTGYSFGLKKSIPAGAGLGGGSSDAASSLRGLNTLHNETLAKERLHKVAASIGSDVPFLVNGGTAVVSGRGEIVEPFDWPFDFTYLIVYPGIAVSTAGAYGNIGKDYDDGEKFCELIKSTVSGEILPQDFLDGLSNDFEKTVFAEYPLLMKLKHFMTENGASASLLSGSGSTVFGIFDNPGQAVECRTKIEKSPLMKSSFRIYIAEYYRGIQ